MTLTQPTEAIQCIPNYGPAFGGGCDIAVCDECNVVAESCTNFAFSYNSDGKYGYNQ